MTTPSIDIDVQEAIEDAFAYARMTIRHARPNPRHPERMAAFRKLRRLYEAILSGQQAEVPYTIFEGNLGDPTDCWMVYRIFQGLQWLSEWTLDRRSGTQLNELLAHFDPDLNVPIFRQCNVSPKAQRAVLNLPRFAENDDRWWVWFEAKANNALYMESGARMTWEEVPGIVHHKPTNRWLLETEL